MHSSQQPDCGLLKAARTAWLSIGLAVGLACLVLLTLLGHKALNSWDEAIYAEVAREMLSSGWLVPHWNCAIWLEKPPLMLWITAASFRLFGVTEFWARAGSALSGVALVGLLHGWLLRRRGQLAAWLCTGLLLSTFGFLHAARVAEMDVLLTFGCCLGLCGLTAVEERTASGWYLFWVGFAVAAMTKGGASLVLPLAAIVLAVADRWSKPFSCRSFWWGLLLFSGLVLPWHLLMLYRYRQQFVHEYVGYHLLARAAQPLEGHLTHWWFYLWVMFVSAMPWVLLYPVSLYMALRQSELRTWSVFALVVLVFFTVVQTRLPHYIVPVYPVMAVLTACFLAPRISNFFSARRLWKTVLFHGSMALTACLATAAMTTSARGRLHRAREFSMNTVARDKETLLLLREFSKVSRPIQGAVLIWREDRTSSIAASVFYAKHCLRQVQLAETAPGRASDRYIDNPLSLEQAVNARPTLLLLDKSLVGQVPRLLHYEALKSGATMEIGWIERR